MTKLLLLLLLLPIRRSRWRQQERRRSCRECHRTSQTPWPSRRELPEQRVLLSPSLPFFAPLSLHVTGTERGELSLGGEGRGSESRGSRDACEENNTSLHPAIRLSRDHPDHNCRNSRFHKPVLNFTSSYTFSLLFLVVTTKRLVTPQTC